MVLRMSQLLLKTLRDDPADAETPSHKLLVRAGYVRRSSAGRVVAGCRWASACWTTSPGSCARRWTPSAARRCCCPRCCPARRTTLTGRAEEYGDLLFRLKDRKGADYVLGPTHEEIFTQLVKDQATSYRDLPVILYQMQTKYRDEARPRSGVLRGREFLMKDAYSFDTTDEGLAQAYRLHREAYIRIFRRLGLDFRIVSAVSGAMGGSASEEFLAPAAAGEDTFARLPRLRLRRQHRGGRLHRGRARRPTDPGPVEELDTPGTATVEALAAALRRARLGRPEEPAGHRGRRDHRRGRARRPRGRPRQARRAPRARRRRAGHRRGLRGPPRPGARLRRPAGPRHPLPRRPPGRPRHLLDHRRQQARPARRATWCAGGTSPSTATSTWSPSSPATPAPAAAPGSPWTAPSRSATSSSSAASTPTPSSSTSSARTASRSASPWAATASASPARWPPSPSRPPTARACAGPPRSPPPTCTSSPRARAPPPNWPPRAADALHAAGCGSCSTTGPRCRPGVKFTDAELIGVPRLLVAGRRAAEGTVELRDRRTGEPRGAPLCRRRWSGWRRPRPVTAAGA